MGKGLCANSSGLTHRELVCGAGLHSCLRFRRAVDVLLTHSRPTAISRSHSDQATEHSWSTTLPLRAVSSRVVAALRLARGSIGCSWRHVDKFDRTRTVFAAPSRATRPARTPSEAEPCLPLPGTTVALVLTPGRLRFAPRLTVQRAAAQIEGPPKPHHETQSWRQAPERRRERAQYLVLARRRRLASAMANASAHDTPSTDNTS